MSVIVDRPAIYLLKLLAQSPKQDWNAAVAEVKQDQVAILSCHNCRFVLRTVYQGIIISALLRGGADWYADEGYNGQRKKDVFHIGTFRVMASSIGLAVRVSPSPLRQSMKLGRRRQCCLQQPLGARSAL